jgi:pre-mRNA-processing factor 39
LLWDKYIEFEKSKKRFDRVGKLFWRVLQIPTSKLHDYYKRFRNYIEARGRKMDHYGANLPPQPSPDEVDPNDPHYNSKIEMLFSARCEEAKQARIKEIVRQYEATVQEYNKRRLFEQNIKRHFFHSKALDEGQLSNWREYCEFEERQGDDERIRLLYERSIVPTCYYTEFWVRYASYLHRTQSEEAARRLFIRANTHFLSRRPWLFVSQGHFEEMLGNLDEARRLYKLVYEDKAPGYYDALFRHLNLERREKNFHQVDKLYELAYDIAINSGQDPLLVFVTKHYAEYLLSQNNDVHGALSLYEEVLQQISSRKSLFLGYILFLRHLADPSERLQKARYTFEKSIGKETQVILIFGTCIHNRSWCLKRRKKCGYFT